MKNCQLKKKLFQNKPWHILFVNSLRLLKSIEKIGDAGNTSQAFGHQRLTDYKTIIIKTKTSIGSNRLIAPIRAQLIQAQLRF